METREKFEALPEIATHLDHGNVFFNEEKKTYASEFSCLHIVACYVNGAWMMFQDQQKNIDAVLNYIEHEQWCDEYGDNQCPVFKIKELLK